MSKRLKGNPVCDNCAYGSLAESVCIMGSGPLSADVMIILDSPGYSEDRTGTPIEGKNKAFFYELLKEAGINPQDCYITNTIKCLVPPKHKVKVSEIKACSDYLELEFQKINPKYVLLFGSNSLSAVIGKGKITQVHGQTVEKDRRIYMPVFSPGVAFRDPKKLEPLKMDLKRFAQLIEGKLNNKPELNLKVIKDFEDFDYMIKKLQKTKVASFDIETTSLVRFKGTITMLGIGTPKYQFVLPLNIEGSPFKEQKKAQTQMIEIISETLEGKKVVSHNGKFDNLWLRYHYGVRIHNSFDTMIASYIMDENSPNGLKYLARLLLGAPDWDIEKDTKTGQGSLDSLCEYLGYDVYWTLKLYSYFKKKLLADKPLLKIFKYLMMPVFHTYEDVQEEGVYIVKDQFDVVDKYLNDQLKEVDKELADLAHKENINCDNWGSTKQVGDVLFNQLKLPILEKTPTGNPATGESILMRLRDEHPVVELLLRRRGIKQQISFFIDGWKKRMHNDKIYPNFNIHTTVTGRTSSNEPKGLGPMLEIA